MKLMLSVRNTNIVRMGTLLQEQGSRGGVNTIRSPWINDPRVEDDRQPPSSTESGWGTTVLVDSGDYPTGHKFSGLAALTHPAGHDDVLLKKSSKMTVEHQPNDRIFRQMLGARPMCHGTGSVVWEDAKRVISEELRGSNGDALANVLIPANYLESFVGSSGVCYKRADYTKSSPRKANDPPACIVITSLSACTLSDTEELTSIEGFLKLTSANKRINEDTLAAVNNSRLGFADLWNSLPANLDEPDDPKISMNYPSSWSSQDMAAAKITRSDWAATSREGNYDKQATHRRTGFNYLSGSNGSANQKEIHNVFWKRLNHGHDLRGLTTGFCYKLSSMSQSATDEFEVAELQLHTARSCAMSFMNDSSANKLTRLFLMVNIARFGTLTDEAVWTDDTTRTQPGAFFNALMASSTESPMTAKRTLARFAFNSGIGPQPFRCLEKHVLLESSGTLTQVDPKMVPSIANTTGSISWGLYGAVAFYKAAFGFDGTEMTSDSVYSNGVTFTTTKVMGMPMIGMQDRPFPGGSADFDLNATVPSNSGIQLGGRAHCQEAHLQPGTIATAVYSDASGVNVAVNSSIVANVSARSWPLAGNSIGYISNARNALFEDGVESDVSDWDDGDEFFGFFISPAMEDL